MKIQITQLAIIIGLGLTLAVSANAQMSQTYRANIPFDFYVGSKIMPSGEYEISRANPMSENGAIIVRNSKNCNTVVVQTVSQEKAERNTASKLLFDRFGGEYFLAKIDSAGMKAKFHQSRQQIRLGKLTKPQTEAVAITKK